MKRLNALRKAVKGSFNQKVRDRMIGAATLGAVAGAYSSKIKTSLLGAGLGVMAVSLGHLKHLRDRYKAFMKEQVTPAIPSNIIRPRRKPIPRGYSLQQPGKRITSGVKIGAHNLIGGKRSFYQTSLHANRINNRLRRRIGPTSYASNISESIRIDYLRALAKYYQILKSQD